MKPRPQTLAGKLHELAKLPLLERIDCSLAGGAMELSPSLSPRITLARAQLRSGFHEHTKWYPREKMLAESINRFSTEIARVPRFSLDQKVTDAALKLRKTPIEKILPHFDKARPPFDKMWVEFSHKVPCIADGMIQQGEMDTKTGFLVTFAKNSGIEMRHAYIPYAEKTASTPICYFDDKTIITPQGINHHLAEIGAPDHLNYDRMRGFEDDAHIALCVFLLMNSRSKVIKAGEEVRARGPVGYIEPVGLRPVTFDLSRVLKNHKGISAAEAERILAEQMVRGHFKVRETGVFFWSPHIRNMQAGSTPEEAWSRQLARPREDVIRHPERELVTPQGTPIIPPGMN